MTESYKKALKEYYEIQKEGEQISSLLNPTPAGLRDLLILKMEVPLDDLDKKIMEHFLEIPFAEITPNKLRSETDRFKALANFLKEKSGGSDLRRLEMIALLLDFKQRPYRKFLKNHKNISAVENITADKESNVEISTNKLEPTEVEEFMNEGISIVETKENKPEFVGFTQEVSIKNQTNVPLKKIGLIGFLVVIIGISLFMNMKNFTAKDCMVWKDDKYEAVDCSETINSFAETALPKNEQLIKEFRKIKVDRKTSFFDKKGNPKVWYIKNQNGTLEFFNQPGLHPETGKTLRPISKYIIEEYVIKQKRS